jgi:cytoskeletal protein RodZ
MADRHIDLGSKLRATRERRGMSLRQIAAATKISVSALEALERNDIARLPGGIFSRAFVRAYAIEIGLDPEEAIQDFIAQFPHTSVTAGHAQAHQVDDSEALESDRRMASAFLKLIAVSVPIAGVVLYFGTAGRRRPPAERPPQAAAHPAEESAAHMPPIATGVVPAVAPAVAEHAARLSVEVVAQRVCSVTATLDGTPGSERLFAAGERQTFEAERELVLKVGDAAAVTWSVNGAPARPLGISRQVATVRLTPFNYKDYVTQR